jgi:hypothetical protein
MQFSVQEDRSSVRMGRLSFWLAALFDLSSRGARADKTRNRNEIVVAQNAVGDQRRIGQ